jgi:hypothetical protein
VSLPHSPRDSRNTKEEEEEEEESLFCHASKSRNFTKGKTKETDACCWYGKSPSKVGAKKTYTLGQHGRNGYEKER